MTATVTPAESTVTRQPVRYAAVRGGPSTGRVITAFAVLLAAAFLAGALLAAFTV